MAMWSGLYFIIIIVIIIIMLHKRKMKEEKDRCCELCYSRFTRIGALPSAVKMEEVVANYEDDILVKP